MNKLLEIKDLKIHFYADSIVPAVDGVSFNVYEKETLCIVGESGCGKSVTSLSIMQLVAMPPGRLLNGEIYYKGKNILNYSKNEMSLIRGKEIAMIFQEPMTALNPVKKIGAQIGEALVIHEGYKKRDAFKKAIEVLKIVGVPDPDRCADSYPHQLSGGMRQRAMIAMAISCNPNMLIADEPTTALDVTIQQQILEVIKSLKESIGMTVMFITHDLGVVAEIADRVIVMYAGKIVEEAQINDLFKKPLHPYTEALLKCIPRVDVVKEKLYDIKGNIPNPSNFPTGCRFHPRCSKAIDICKVSEPEEINLGTRRVSCHLININEEEVSYG